MKTNEIWLFKRDTVDICKRKDNFLETEIGNFNHQSGVTNELSYPL